MKKNITPLILLFIMVSVISCSINKGNETTKTFKFYNRNYSIILPNQQFTERFFEVGLNATEYQLVFNDSSKIFCTDHVSASNLIQPLLRPQDYLTFLDNDSLYLSFKENNQFYCVRKIGDVFIGYSSVSTDNKEKFDRVINNVVYKRELSKE